MLSVLVGAAPGDVAALTSLYPPWDFFHIIFGSYKTQEDIKNSIILFRF